MPTGVCVRPPPLPALAVGMVQHDETQLSDVRCVFKTLTQPRNYRRDWGFSPSGSACLVYTSPSQVATPQHLGIGHKKSLVDRITNKPRTTPRHERCQQRARLGISSLACILRELISVSRTLCRFTSPHAVHRFWPIHARTLACSRTAAACWSSCAGET